MRSSETHSINDFDSTIDLSGIPVDTRSPVMVTGATGYLGSWVTKGLLDAGITVRAAVRDPQNTNKVAHLNRMAEQTPGTLRLFAGDLLQPGSYDEAMEGCAIVIHTASPILHSTDDPQHDLIEPALEGTRNVLPESSARRRSRGWSSPARSWPCTATPSTSRATRGES